jgi:MFS family permease
MALESANRAALGIAPGVLLAGVAAGIAFPILPDVGMRTHMPFLLIGAILAANRLGRIVSAPVVGSAADRFGGRKLLLVGMATQIIVGVCYLLGVTTRFTAAFFLIGRLIQGPGSSCVFVAAQALALHAGGREHGGLAAGTVRAAMSIGLPAGVALGGVLSSRFGEQATFGAAIVALVLATCTAWLFVPSSRAEVAQRLPMREVLVALLRDRRMAAVGVLNFAVTFSALGLVLTTLIFVVGSQRKMAASLLMGWMIVAMGLATLVASRRIKTMRGHVSACVSATALLALSMFVIALARTDMRGLLFGLTLLGASAGVLSSSLLSVVGDAAKREQLGAAVGVVQLCGDVGGVLGPIIGSALLVFGPAPTYTAGGVLIALFVPIAIGLARHQGALRSPAA